MVKWGSCTFTCVKFLCMLGFLTLCGVAAHGQELGHPGPPIPAAELRGRVFERGTLTPLNGARVVTIGAATATDADGRFSLRVAPGATEVSITLEGYEPLKVVEQARAGEGIEVEYRLLSLPAYRKRYVSTVRGEARHEGERFVLRDEEIHQAPGTLGDPFRVIGLLPGVATPITLLPIYVIRGASPGTNGFFLDGMRVPQLFHFVVGGGVVHPRLIDRLDFYPGVYDVSFGHYAGGVIDSETHPGRSDAPAHGEIELKLYDLMALVEVKLPGDVKVEAAGHYGFPSYLIHVFDARANVSYWDFQLRADWKSLTVEAFGSYDYLTIVTDRGRPATPTRAAIPASVAEERLDFYRLQIRDRRKIGRVEIEAALVGGYDEFSAVGPTVPKLSLAWRANAKARWKRFRLFAGFDGEISRFTATNFDSAAGADQPDALGELAGQRDGVEAGAFVEGTLELVSRRLWLTAGVRADVYHANAVTLLGVDPRFQFRAKLLPQLFINGGIGLYQQPPSFPIPLPGIDTFALQLGLQRALQAAYGVEAELPEHINVKVTGYWEQFYNINDVVLDFTTQVVCTSPPPESLTGFPARITRQIDGHSYGMEILRAQAGGPLHRLDRLHAVAHRAHLLVRPAPGRLRSDARAQRGAAGAAAVEPDGRRAPFCCRPAARSPCVDPTNLGAATRNNTRLPDYYQLDLRIDREWIFAKWALSVFLEVVNLTYSAERDRPDLPDRSRHGHHPLRHAPIERLQLDPAVDRRARTILMSRPTQRLATAAIFVLGCSYTFDTTEPTLPYLGNPPDTAALPQAQHQADRRRGVRARRRQAHLAAPAAAPT